MFEQMANDMTVLYTDRMTVYRSNTITNDDDSEDNVLSDIPIMQNEKCRVSYKTLDMPYQITNTGEPITTAIKIFCAPDIDIQAGDNIKATKNGKVYQGRAGDPAQYASHKEIVLTYRDKA